VGKLNDSVGVCLRTARGLFARSETHVGNQSTLVSSHEELSDSLLVGLVRRSHRRHPESSIKSSLLQVRNSFEGIDETGRLGLSPLISKSHFVILTQEVGLDKEAGKPILTVD
jgi:hypothetical protein